MGIFRHDLQLPPKQLAFLFVPSFTSLSILRKPGMIVRRVFLISFVLLTSCAAQDPAQFFNPLIGTAKGGHVFPGATLAWGSVKAGPAVYPTRIRQDMSAMGYQSAVNFHFRYQLTRQTRRRHRGRVVLGKLPVLASYQY